MAARKNLCTGLDHNPNSLPYRPSQREDYQATPCAHKHLRKRLSKQQQAQQPLHHRLRVVYFLYPQMQGNRATPKVSPVRRRDLHPELLTYVSAADSVFSGWTRRSAVTESSWATVDTTVAKGHLIQPLSPTSFVTQSTEVTVSPRESVKACEQVATIVHISSAGSAPVHRQGPSTKRYPVLVPDAVTC